MSRLALSLVALGLLATPLLVLSQSNPAPVRPPIVGVAHIGLQTNDLDAARNFYGHILGYQEPFTVDKPTGGLMLTYFKVNDHQYIEVFPELEDRRPGSPLPHRL